MDAVWMVEDVKWRGLMDTAMRISEQYTKTVNVFGNDRTESRSKTAKGRESGQKSDSGGV